MLCHGFCLISYSSARYRRLWQAQRAVGSFVISPLFQLKVDSKKGFSMTDVDRPVSIYEVSSEHPRHENCIILIRWLVKKTIYVISLYPLFKGFDIALLSLMMSSTFVYNIQFKIEKSEKLVKKKSNLSKRCLYILCWIKDFRRLSQEFMRAPLTAQIRGEDLFL